MKRLEAEAGSEDADTRVRELPWRASGSWRRKSWPAVVMGKSYHTIW